MQFNFAACNFCKFFKIVNIAKISCFTVVLPFFPRISNSFGTGHSRWTCFRDDLYFSTQFNNHMNTGIGVSQSNISRNEYIYIYKKDIDF